MDDLVSIVMPSYQTEAFIHESIQSVIDQSYGNWELLIVDDCSTDRTRMIVSSFQDQRIKLFVNDRNSGAAVSRNRALREARGKWIAFLDSDDIWYPNKLERQLVFMKNNGYHFSYTEYEEINADGEKTGVHVSGPKKITEWGMCTYCWPGCLTVMYDRDFIGLIQIADIKKNNDYAMWLKVCRKSDCRLLGEVLAQYRRGRPNSVSNQKIRTMIKWHYLLFRDAENQGKLASIFHTVMNLIFGVIKKVLFTKRAAI